LNDSIVDLPVLRRLLSEAIMPPEWRNFHEISLPDLL
jgi:hypothetical protein